MKQRDKAHNGEGQLSRRRFLTGVAGAAPAAAAVAMVPGAVNAVPEADQPAGEQAKGYRLTSHILAYYKSVAR